MIKEGRKRAFAERKPNFSQEIMGLFGGKSDTDAAESLKPRPDAVLPGALDLPLFNKLRGASSLGAKELVVESFMRMR